MQGRARSPLRAALANPRFLIYHDGAHGVTRPTIAIPGYTALSPFFRAARCSAKNVCSKARHSSNRRPAVISHR